MGYKESDLCKHGLIRDWCADCKHLDTKTVEEMIMEENKRIVRNFNSWPKNGKPIT